MESVLRRLKLRRSNSRESDTRKNVQEDLYEYSRFRGLGFPNKPSSLTYSVELDLLAIGTQSGALRLYGQPGVCVQGQHSGDVSVTNIFFISHKGELVILCSDNSLHLWALTLSAHHSLLEEKKSIAIEMSKQKTITSCCLLDNGNSLLLGTQGGNLHFFDVALFTLTDQVLLQEIIIQNTVEENADGDEFKVGPGVIESICQHPTDRNKILIGFSHGLIVLWSLGNNSQLRTYNSVQTLEFLTFTRRGNEFISSHTDGSYIVWNTSDASVPKEPATAPYGPFPCKSITKLLWKTTNIEPFIVFSGGMPRASYGDHYTVTIMHDDSHVVLDFTSKVIDFVILCNADKQPDCAITDGDCPHSLIVLTEEELVAVDLTTSSWPLFRLPYLVSLHCSVITSMNFVNNVPETLWNKIVNAGNIQFVQHSSRDWPVSGGKAFRPKVKTRDLLLTGHENGSVNFWDVSDGSIKLLLKLQTANLFGIDTSMHGDGSGNSECYDEWPPFRKVGIFDPFTDDPRLAIQKIEFCLLSETLVLAGTAGQIVLFQYEREEREQDIKIAVVNVVTNRDNFVWRGHNSLEVKNCESKLAPGFQPVCVVQMLPPVPCTALAFQPEWQLLAMGTAYGVGLFDCVRCKTVYTRCTITCSDGSSNGTVLSRRKSFQKMLRQSLRRLRGQHVESHQPSSEQGHNKEVETKSSGQIEFLGEGDVSKPDQRSSQINESVASTSANTIISPGPSEPCSRSSQMTSIVRCLHFAQVFLYNTQTYSASLWVGTNLGTVCVYHLTIPSNDRRMQDAVQCNLAKEIRLRHGAPVVNIQVLDHSGLPHPAPLEVQHERARAPDMTGSHFVVICSQQQLKVFSLPSVKPYQKYKLSSQRQEAQLSSISYARFRSKKDETYAKTDAVGLTTDGEMSVFSIPQLKPQIRCNVIAKENISGVNGCVITPDGMGFFLCSPSELERFSLSARFPSAVACKIELGESSRTRTTDADALVSRERDDGDIAEADDVHLAVNEQLRSNFLRVEENNRLQHSLNIHEVTIPQAPGTETEEHREPLTSNTLPSDNNFSTPADNGHMTALNSALNGSLLLSTNNTPADVSTVAAVVSDNLTRSSMDNSAVDSSTAPHSIEPVTCATVIDFPSFSKVVKADVHVPCNKGNYKTVIEEMVSKELSNVSSPKVATITGN